MTQRIFRAHFTTALLAALAGLLLVQARLPAEPVLDKQDRLVAQLVCTFLQQGHLARPEINDELSRRLFQRFLKEADPYKLYFLQSDIDEFKKHETELDDMLLKGDLSFAYQVYERLVTRLGQRQKLIEELVKAPHDFTVKESLSTDFDAIPYAQGEDDLRERWRKQIKYGLLLERLGPKPLPEAEAKAKVLSRYRSLLKMWKQMDNHDLLERYLSGLTASVDPHSTYMSPTTLADFDIALHLHLEGMGALLRSENGQTIIVEVIPGGAAAVDGRLKANDKIIGVAQGDDKFVDVMDRKLTDVVKLIRGAHGTKVQLKVIPAGKIEPVVYDLTRQKVELKSQEAPQEVIEQGKKPDGMPYRIGVIDLPSFYSDPGGKGDKIAGKDAPEEPKSATEDVRKILKEFTAKGVDGVILDLRRNGGGSLREALALTGLFIDKGAIVQVKGSEGRVQRGDDPEKGTVYAGPLIVLVSRLSASASEILAGALQDYGRALVVGDSATHGKGTVQVVINLGDQLRADPPPNLGALKLTIQQFYRVNGDSTQNRGVTADIIVPSLTDVLAGEKDLEHALTFDRVAPVKHEHWNLVSADLKAALQARSTERVKKSEEFAKLAKQAALLKSQRERKAIPLNEQELRDTVGKEGAEKDDGTKTDEDTPPMGAAYKFRRNDINNELLHIMEDYLQGKKPETPAR